MGVFTSSGLLYLSCCVFFSVFCGFRRCSDFFVWLAVFVVLFVELVYCLVFGLCLFNFLRFFVFILLVLLVICFFH